MGKTTDLLTKKTKTYRRKNAAIAKTNAVLPKKRHDTEGTTKAFLWLGLGVLIVLLVLNVKMAQAEAIGYGESHSPMEEYAATYRPALFWPGAIEIQQFGKNDDFSESDFARVIEYGNWSWGQRSGAVMNYTGVSPTFADGATGKIVLKIIDPFEMQSMTGSYDVRGRTRYWYELDSGAMVGALVYLNSLYFTKKNYDCAMQVALHEIGHAIGIANHSGDNHAVMYTSGAPSCQYALSASDALLASSNADTCHAELTMSNEIYIPDILGKRARLKYNGDMTWSLISLSDNPQSKGCTQASVNESMEIKINDLRGFWGSYSNVRLEPIGNDLWKLGWAE